MCGSMAWNAGGLTVNVREDDGLAVKGLCVLLGMPGGRR